MYVDTLRDNMLSGEETTFLNGIPFGTAYRWAHGERAALGNQATTILSAPVGDYACYEWALKSCQPSNEVLDARAISRGYLTDAFGFRETAGLGPNLCIDDALAAWGGSDAKKQAVRKLARDVATLIGSVDSAEKLGQVETYLVGKVLVLNGFDVMFEGAKNHAGYKVAWHTNALETESDRPYFPSIEHAWLEYGTTTIQKTSGARIEIGRGQNYGRIGTYETIRMHRIALRSF
ncbi:MAG TPA: hypothetical protein VFQ35_26220, partial [Polyangiaceae bacterium]|nr:hypothetical protein [Polyangiaceae bacterium]